MAATAANVRVGVTGTVNYAVPGTALPTDNAAVLNVAFKDQGYITEDGIKQSIGETTTDIRAWQNGSVVRRVVSAFDVKYMLTLLETSADTLKTYYNDYTTGDVKVKGGQGLRGCWVFEIVDGSSKIRIVIPDGQVTERGEITYANSDAITYPIGIITYPDATGVNAYIYTDLA